MSEATIRHMYPGGNTPIGFFSYYPYIIDRKKAKRIYILKGGPGTGKSTLMRKVGLELAKKGFNVEFMHCSSDNNSLDGVVIPDLGIAMVDGTSPHIVDPVYPGAVDEIINLGQYWNEEGFEDSRQEIIAVNSKIKSHFATAYRYLRAVSALQEDTESIYEEALDKGRENLFSRELILLVLGDRPPARTPGNQRCLFASAITPRGFSDYLDSLCINHKIIRLSAPIGISTHRILETLKYESLLRGLDIETFFCPMSPHRIEHIVIPQLSVSIITANEYHDVSVMDDENCSTYFVNKLYEKEKLERFSKQLGFNRLYSEALLERAIESIAAAKASHDELEKYYIKNMDFDGLSKLRDHFLEQLLSIKL